MPLLSVFSLRRVDYGLRRFNYTLLALFILGMMMACSSPGTDDEDLPVSPTPSPGTDTTLISDTLPPDTLSTDTAIINPDTTVAAPDTPVSPRDTTVVAPDTARPDTIATGKDTVARKYYSVKEAQALYADMEESEVSVMGYVVGTVKGQTLNGKRLTGPWGVETNILIADTPTPESDDALMPVELKKGSKARNALNLVGNPAIYHKRVIITGNLRTYFRVAGLKSVKNYIILGE